jgi:hypothetical protein
MPGYNFSRIAWDCKLKTAEIVLSTLKEYVDSGCSLPVKTVSDIVDMTDFTTKQENELVELSKRGFQRHTENDLLNEAKQYKELLKNLERRHELLHAPALRHHQTIRT